MAKDHYKILGVEKKASKDDIKSVQKTSRINIIPTKRVATSKSLRRRAKHTKYFLTTANARNTTHTGRRSRAADIATGFGGAQGFGGFNAQDFQGMEFDLGDIFGDFSAGAGPARSAPRPRHIGRFANSI